MQVRFFHIDAFTEQRFSGNSAGVCLLDYWLSDELMQRIAAENQLAETAFLVRDGEDHQLRWFTPRYEIDLCGHATLAAAFVICEFLEPNRDRVRFSTKSGCLEVAKVGGRLRLDFPARPGQPIMLPPGVEAVFASTPPVAAVAARDLMLVFESEDQVRRMHPDLAPFAALPYLGLIVTAPGDEVDFVSRFLQPGEERYEDFVTGSAHCTLVPYWAKRLGRRVLRARQISSRPGNLWCEDAGDRVFIAGHAVLYLQGFIEI